MNPKKARLNCLVCGMECARPGSKFCSNKCQGELSHRKTIEKWELEGVASSDSIRRHLMRTQDGKCSLCQWTGQNVSTGMIPLELHHKDGNWKNNRRENVELICPNCHSLTPNLRALNSGRCGFESRRYYFKTRVEGSNPSVPTFTAGTGAHAKPPEASALTTDPAQPVVPAF